MAVTKPLTLTFADDGAVPNNPLPALVYKVAVISATIRQASCSGCLRRTAGATASGAMASIRSRTII